ncbi:MAG TPA: FAD/NAD(P)-binding oxidoreductase [Chloroflexota bacterium]
MNSAEGTTQGRHVVIAGGSFAGLGAAYSVRQALPPTDRVTVVSSSAQFVFAPSLVWAALGRPLVRSTFALEPALQSKGIEFIHSHVRRVEADRRIVETDEGPIDFDRLVIATGGQPDSVTIPGLAGEFRAANWVVGEDSALEARTVLRHLIANPGPLIIGVAQGASYLSAPYELALALDLAMRKRGIREKVPMTFVTFEPYIGHLGLDHIEAHEKLERLFQERAITTYANAWIERISKTGGSVGVTVEGQGTLDAAAAIIMPPFTGVADIWKSAKLSGEDGLIPVDKQYRHIRFPDVYAVGVAARFNETIEPLGYYGKPPHTGYLSLHMGKIAGKNVAASLGHGSPSRRTLPEMVDIRVLDGGDAGLLLTSRGKNQLQMHNRARSLSGRSAHFLKKAIERYLVWRLRTGRINLP